ncbi:death domain-associated protein 6 isoform X2 [Callorhinchus milii]|uniref:death domain-associated protein 6 isoform X2 n=1 Tax=Callorhinchus milii TaxID=7868 RepID=UPI001C3F981D|nr:death domain-associated protein 6 isoform X2 [Callorhinchus milii]
METPGGDGIVNLLTDDEEEEEEKPEAQASPGAQPGPGSQRRLHLQPPVPVPVPVELSAILTGVELAGEALMEEQRQRERGLVLRENQRLFTEFVDFCRTLTEENPEVINFLEKKYSKAFGAYLSSTEFRNVLGRCLTRVQSKRSKVFVYIKELCTALKANSQKTKAALGAVAATAMITGRDGGPEGRGDQLKAPAPDRKRSGGGSRRQIRYLENLLSVYTNEIRRLQEKELDLNQLEDEDSVYIQEHRLKKKMVKIFQKLCELKSCSSLTGRVIEQRIAFTGTRYPEVNRRVERFINKPDNFPDYQDIRNIITKANARHGLGLGQRHIQSMAQDAFREVGNRLQERRHLDLVYNFGSHLTDDYKPGKDPALMDTGLDKRLKANRSLAMSHLDEVVKKYAGIQDVGEIEEEERRRQKKLLQAASAPEPTPTTPAEPSSTTSPTPAPDSTDPEERTRGGEPEGKPEERQDAMGSEEEDGEEEEEEEEEEDDEEEEEDDLSSDPDIEEELAKIPEEAEGEEEAQEEEKLAGSEAEEGEPSDESVASSDEEESRVSEEEETHRLNGGKEEEEPEGEGGVSADRERGAGEGPPGGSGHKCAAVPIAVGGSGAHGEPSPITAATATETGTGSTSEGGAVTPATAEEGRDSKNGGGASEGGSPLMFDHEKATEARELHGLSPQDTNPPSVRSDPRQGESQSPPPEHEPESAPSTNSLAPPRPRDTELRADEKAARDEPCSGKMQERHAQRPETCLTAVNGRKRESTNHGASPITKRVKREVGAQDCGVEVIELMESDEGSEELAGGLVTCEGVKSAVSALSSSQPSPVNVATQCDPEEIIVLSDSD